MKRFKINLYVMFSALLLGALLLTLVASRAQASFIPGDDSDMSGYAPTAPVLDHYWCYHTQSSAVNQPVLLQDQFDKALVPATVGAPELYCNPVKKKHNGIVYKVIDPNAHLIFYKIGAPTQLIHTVQVNNQFGKQTLEVYAPARDLAVPTNIPGTPPPASLDHFKCYRVKGAAPQAVVALKDMFTSAGNLTLGVPVLLCNPTVKVHNNNTYKIQHPKAHLVCYNLTQKVYSGGVGTTNQFRSEQIKIGNPNILCAPSTKKIIQ